MGELNVPPIRMEIIFVIYHGTSGICLGNVFTRVGCSYGSLPYPRKAPTKVNGTEIPNHNAQTANMEVNGTAALLPYPHTNKLMIKNPAKMRPGNNKAVKNVVAW